MTKSLHEPNVLQTEIPGPEPVRKLRVLVVDHAAHEKTGSSDFFLTALYPVCNVTVRWFDPAAPSISLARLAKVDWKQFDLVIAWQLEVLALLPMSVGVPALVVPMFDGSCNQPNDHWWALRGASTLNFSYNLHLLTRGKLANASLMKFFPDPARFRPIDDYTHMRAFFWERAPNEVSATTAFKLLQDQPASWHVHFAPDVPGAPATVLPPDANLTSSTWFPARENFDAVVDRHNVAIAPRRSEGIGMFALECMARGMCVVASSLPSHTEYIADGVTGYLFDPQDPRPVKLQDFAAVGRRARQAVVRGHTAFQEQLSRLPEFLNLAARTQPRGATPPSEASKLVALYFNDPEAYRERLRQMRGGDVTLVHRAQLEAPMRAGSSLSLERWRTRMRGIPGWQRIKAMVPSSLKYRVATTLARLLPQ